MVAKKINPKKLHSLDNKKSIERIGEESLQPTSSPHQSLSFNDSKTEDYSWLIERKKIMKQESKQGVIEDIRSQYIRIALEKNPDWNKATDLIIKEYIEKYYVFKSIESDRNNEWWVYDAEQGIYLSNGLTRLKIILEDLLDFAYNDNIFKKVVARLEPRSNVSSDDFFNKTNSNFPHYVAVNNGILNIETKELMPFSPDYVFLNKLKMDYNPGIKSVNIPNFLNSVLSYKEDVDTIYEFLGYCLYKKTINKQAFILYGKTGDNGKTILIELLETFLTPDNVSNLNLYDLLETGSAKNFELGSLYNKLANFCGDIGSRYLSETSLETFKKLTGGDRLEAKRKFLDSLKFISYAKLLFSCNKLPRFDMKSPSIRNRLNFINFDYQFLSQDAIDELNVIDRKNVRLKAEKDELISLITNDKELSGLLNLALVGFERLRSNCFVYSNNTNQQDKLNKTKETMFNLIRFVKQECNKELYSHLSKEEFREAYVFWCNQNGEKIMGDREILHILEDEFSVGQKRLSVDGERQLCWYGLRFKTLDEKNNKSTYQEVLK